jgi:hypothetical protein
LIVEAILLQRLAERSGMGIGSSGFRRCLEQQSSNQGIVDRDWRRKDRKMRGHALAGVPLTGFLRNRARVENATCISRAKAGFLVNKGPREA